MTSSEVKLIMTWDILPEHQEEYFEFVVREFIPGMHRIGLEPKEAWFTWYGDRDQPQIMAEATTPSLVDVKRILASEEWRTLFLKLMNYVDGFQLKVVPSRTGFQI